MTTKNVNYYDFALPLLGRVGVKKNYTNIKIPCFNLIQYYHVLDKVFLVNIDTIETIVKYELVDSKGYTQPKFKQIEEIGGEQVRKARMTYKKVRKSWGI